MIAQSQPFDILRVSWSAIRAPYRLTPESQRTTRFYQWRLTRAELAQLLAKEGFTVEDVHVIGKRQGLQRMMQNTMGLDATSTLARGAAFLFAPFVPEIWIDHMILAVARKPV